MESNFFFSPPAPAAALRASRRHWGHRASRCLTASFRSSRGSSPFTYLRTVSSVRWRMAYALPEPEESAAKRIIHLAATLVIAPRWGLENGWARPQPSPLGWAKEPSPDFSP